MKPVYILNFPFDYDTDTDKLNVTGKENLSDDLKIDTSTVLGQGIKIYGLTNYLTTPPLFDAGNSELVFNTFEAGNNVKVYGGNEGKPVSIKIDEETRVEGDGWTYNTSNKIIEIVYPGTSFILTWGGTSGGGVVGGGGSSAAVVSSSEPLTNIFNDVNIPDVGSQNNAIFFGSISIMGLTVIVVSWKEIEKRSSMPNKWNKQLKNLNKPVKGWNKKNSGK